MSETFIAEIEKELPPLPSPDELRRISERHAGQIWQTTVCPVCENQEWGWRLGCSVKGCAGFRYGFEAWHWEARSGAMTGPAAQTAFIKHGRDFLFVDERP